MTYIKAAHSGEGYEGAPGIEVDVIDGHARIHVVGYDYSCVPANDLAAALCLVTREECDARDNEWKSLFEEVRDERDKAEATIARVEVALDHPAVRNGTEGADYHVRKALHPKPAFMLPTEAGVRFEVDHRSGGSFTFESKLLGDGNVYVCPELSCAYTAEEIMDTFTNHRLIETEP